MIRTLASHIAQQWMGALALLLVFSGGAAYAVATITGADVVNNSLTGKDIREGTLAGVTDRCPRPATVRKGTMCVGSDGIDRTFFAAAEHCESLGLRLPTYGEARMLVTRFDLPGVGAITPFWTDEMSFETNLNRVYVISDSAGAPPRVFGLNTTSNTNDALCVRPASDAR